jgi:hypothetical protein
VGCRRWINGWVRVGQCVHARGRERARASCFACGCILLSISRACVCVLLCVRVRLALRAGASCFACGCVLLACGCILLLACIARASRIAASAARMPRRECECVSAERRAFLSCSLVRMFDCKSLPVRLSTSSHRPDLLLARLQRRWLLRQRNAQPRRVQLVRAGAITMNWKKNT